MYIQCSLLDSIENESLPTTKKKSSSSSNTKSPTFPETSPTLFNTTEFEYDTFFCTCDLTKNSCDINCCCDQDCSADDKKVFRGIQLKPI